MDQPDAVTLELGEGFSGDDVVVLADDLEVWRADGVTTNWSVGLADVVRLPGSTRSIEVRSGGRSQRTEVPAGTGEVRLRADRGEDGALRLDVAPEGPLF